VAKSHSHESNHRGLERFSPLNYYRYEGLSVQKSGFDRKNCQWRKTGSLFHSTGMGSGAVLEEIGIYTLAGDPQSGNSKGEYVSY